MTDQQRLEQLLRGGHPCVSMVTYEEAYALDLARETAMKMGVGVSDTPLWVWSISEGLRDAVFVDGQRVPDTFMPAAALLYLQRLQRKLVCVALDLMPHLKDERTLRHFRDLVTQLARTDGQLIMIDHFDEMPPVVAATALRFELSLPDEDELEAIVRKTIKELNHRRKIAVEITRTSLDTIIRNLRGLSRRQAELLIAEVALTDNRFDAADVNHVIAGKRRLLQQGGLLEYIETPVSLEEIGGLGRLKSWLAQRAGAMSKEAVDFGIGAPRGVLMLGVQGAGKSLCAKAIATAWQRPLLRLDPAALYDRYVGESERRLRDALTQAERMAPIVLWVDEIEKGFASAASRSTDGGLSQRMFGTLLTWMQEHRAPVFLVATANDIEALPPELLRKGRFDEIFFVDLPTAATRRQIFAIHLRRRGKDPESFDLSQLVQASDGYSGAEIEAAIVSGLHRAFSAGTAVVTSDIADAIAESPPLSVTMAEKVQNLRDWAKNRCVPAE